jgi:DNA-binding response OmpR family regulator
MAGSSNSKLTLWRPVAHLVVHDPGCRAEISDALHRQGWSVIVHPTGLHLIREISGIILGDQPWQRPGIIVVDAAARGCTGSSIARGLGDLDPELPVVVVGDRAELVDDPTLRIADPARAAQIVSELARPRSPASLLDRPRSAPRRAS